MLKTIKLTNFRCFKEHIIHFSEFNVLVGRNNAGKSTIIDALKLISSVCRYSPYRERYLKESDIPFSMVNVHHDYTEDDAVINAEFSEGVNIQVTFPYNDTPYVDVLVDDEPISGRALSRFKQSIGVIAPVGSFEEHEKPSDKKYLSSIMFSHLMARHFRSIWYHFPGNFDEFRDIIKSTWPQCDIELPQFFSQATSVSMFFKENNMPREVFWAGHGFQVWLQLITSLVKLGHVNTLVLDEPDIYLHSDMQKKLVNICKERSNQVIIATHAVDIIEEVQPEDIICMDKNSVESKRLSSIDQLQTLITELGSFQNLKLVHFLRSNICLFVEGDDFKLLKILAGKLGFQSFVREEGFSIVPMEGFSNWNRLIPMNWVFQNVIGERVKSYIILDKDYHTESEISRIIGELAQKGVQGHVWKRKEIENYAIEIRALYRMFSLKFRERHGSNRTIPLEEEFNGKIDEIFSELKNEILAQILTNETNGRVDRSIAPATITGQILSEFEQKWADVEFRKTVVGGKDFFVRLNRWLNEDFNVSISLSYAFFSLHSEEISGEIRSVLDEIKQFLDHN